MFGTGLYVKIAGILIYLFTFIGIIKSNPLKNWTLSTATWPPGADYQPLTFYNESYDEDCIYVLGGRYACQECFYCYSISNNNFTLYNTLDWGGRNWLHQSGFFIGNKLYYWAYRYAGGSSPSGFREYNFDTSIQTQLTLTLLDGAYFTAACIVRHPINEDYIFVSGYYGGGLSFAVYEISTGNTINYIDFIEQGTKTYLSCGLVDYYNDPYIYFIGSNTVNVERFNLNTFLLDPTYSNYTTEIIQEWTLDPNNIINYNLINETDRMTYGSASYYIRFITFNKYIYLIGGSDNNGNHGTVVSIDLELNTVTYINVDYPNNIIYTGMVVAKNRIYGFNGWDGTSTVDVLYISNELIAEDGGNSNSSSSSNSNTNQPSKNPSNQPTSVPSGVPSNVPTSVPSSMAPSSMPSSMPSSVPSSMPSVIPSDIPSGVPTTGVPSNMPSNEPSNEPSIEPSTVPSKLPTNVPSGMPSGMPSGVPNDVATDVPSSIPSSIPSTNPSTNTPTNPPTDPTRFPSIQPTDNSNNNGNTPGIPISTSLTTTTINNDNGDGEETEETENAITSLSFINGNENLIIILLFVGLIVICLCCSCILLGFICSYLGKKRDKEGLNGSGLHNGNNSDVEYNNTNNINKINNLNKTDFGRVTSETPSRNDTMPEMYGLTSITTDGNEDENENENENEDSVNDIRMMDGTIGTGVHVTQSQKKLGELGEIDINDDINAEELYIDMLVSSKNIDTNDGKSVKKGKETCTNETTNGEIWQEWNTQQVCIWLSKELLKNKFNKNKVNTIIKLFNKNDINGPMLNMFKLNNNVFNQFKNQCNEKSFGIWMSIKNLIDSLE